MSKMQDTTKHELSYKTFENKRKLKQTKISVSQMSTDMFRLL